jgi:hypothetical protein
MKTSYRLFVFATLFALGVACWSGLGSSTAQEKGKEEKGKRSVEPPPKWEYKVTVLGDDDKAAEKELNKLGDEGWELVGTASNVSADARGQGTAPTMTQIRLIFKRPKK